MAELAQRLRLDLADALARDVELLADFLERMVGVHVDAKAHAQDFRLARRELREHRVSRLTERLHRGLIDRGCHRGVLDEVAELRVLVIADGRLHRDRLLGDLAHLAHLVLGHLHAHGELLGGRLAAHLLQHLPRDAIELVDRLDHVHRNADGARLIGDRAGDGLTNPPRCIRRKFVAAAPLELVHRFHQADIAFLNQVEKLQSAIGIFLGDRNNQPQVGFNQFFFGLLGFRLAAVNECQRALQFGEPDFAGFFNVLSSFWACFSAVSYSFAILSMYLSVCLVLLAIFSSVSSSSSNCTISLMDRTPLRKSSPTAISSLITIGERVIDFITTSCPRSMRLAIVTSPSRVNSGTVPISRRYMRTGSFVFSSEPGVKSRSLLPSSECASSLTTTSWSPASAETSTARAAFAEA